MMMMRTNYYDMKNETDLEKFYLDIIKAKLHHYMQKRQLQNGETLFYKTGREITETSLNQYLEYVEDVECQEGISEFILTLERDTSLKLLLL